MEIACTKGYKSTGRPSYDGLVLFKPELLHTWAWTEWRWGWGAEEDGGGEGRGFILSYFPRYLNVINFCSAVVCKYSHTFAKSLSAFNVKVEKWNKEAYIKKVYATAWLLFVPNSCPTQGKTLWKLIERQATLHLTHFFIICTVNWDTESRHRCCGYYHRL